MKPGNYAILFALSMLLSLVSANASLANRVPERPMIWATPAEKSSILEKIEKYSWAQRLYDQLKDRTDRTLAEYNEDREGYLKKLPLDWERPGIEHPVIHKINSDSPGTEGWKHRVVLMEYLQSVVDSGVLYYLTNEANYAQYAADILGVLFSAIAPLEPSENSFNGGLIYPRNHLKEARIIGAQLPVAYDFISPFLEAGNRVYDIATGELRKFPEEDAQKVFLTYTELAINTGITAANWPVLESPSLVHNTLALSDEKLRRKYLTYYLEQDTKWQDSLKTVASAFDERGDVWPESLHYSHGVAAFSVYLMTVLSRE